MPVAVAFWNLLLLFLILQVFGAVDLSDTAHGHQLRAVKGVTANVQPKKWSLAGVHVCHAVCMR